MPQRHELEALYSKDGATISSLAKTYNTSQPTVRKWLIDYSITRKSHKEASQQANNRGRSSPPPRDQLLQDYKYHSIDWIEQKYNVGQQTVYIWLEMYGIEVGDRMILTSSKQRDLFNMIVDRDPDGDWQMNDRKLIYPQELDIISYKRQVALEYCGLYWHSELHKKDTYHLDKLQRCNDNQMRLVTVFESDDLNKVVQFVTQPTSKVSARACDVVFDINVTAFEQAHHLMGAHNAKVTIGLQLDKQLVASMSFSKSRYATNAQWEMIRYTTGPIAVIGGAQRLFSAFVRAYTPQSVVTYSDRRFSSGHVYSMLGFKHQHHTAPNYWYCKRGKATLMSRQLFQKHKLPKVLTNFQPELTERANMLNNDYYRIYDCGSTCWLWVDQQLS